MAHEAASPQRVRNVVLVGHAGSGKTTLVESLLLATGAISRAGSVDDGTTVTDFDDQAKKQHRSVAVAVAACEWDGTKINLIDTPGHPDYVGELRAGLRAADAALFVVSAVDGLDGATALLWDECASVGMPRAVVVTKLDQPRADFDESVAVCQRVFGDGVVPLYLPSARRGHRRRRHRRRPDRAAVAAARRLQRGLACWCATPTPSTPELVEGRRSDLIEAIIQESEDDALMDRYLAGEAVGTDILVPDLERAVARGSFYPVLPVVGETGVGVHELLEIITQGFPSPAEHPLPGVTTPDGDPRGPLTCDPDGPLVAEVVKTTTDPYVGRVSLVRVFSGTLHPDTAVHVSGHSERFSGTTLENHEDHDVDEKVGVLTSPLGGQLRPTGRCIAGDICTVARLTRAETGRHAVRHRRALARRAVGDARTPAARGDPGGDALRRGEDGRGARPASPSRTPRCASSTTPRPSSSCCGRWARRTSASCSTGCRTATACTSRRCPCGCRCARPSWRPAPGAAGWSSRAAATASSRCARSTSSRCRRAAASSSSTRWSAARYRGSTSPASRRACGPARRRA